MPTYDIELQAKVNQSFGRAVESLTKKIDKLTLSLEKHENVSERSDRQRRRREVSVKRESVMNKQLSVTIERTARAKSRLLQEGKRLTAQLKRESVAQERLQRATARAAAAKERFASTSAATASSVGLLHGRLFAMYFLVYRFGTALKRSVDSITSFQNQIRLSTVTSKQYQEVAVGLLKIGRETGNSVEYLSKIYQRFRNALQRYGTTSKEVLRITETMAKTVSAFGLSIPEARGAMIQLSQGMAAGQLRGHELLSVMEQLPPIASLIARELGGFTSDLREWGKQGKITSEVVFRALEKGRVNYGREV